MSVQKKLFCFGYGYTCDYLGRTLHAREGWTIGGTTRDPERQKELRAQGIDAHLFDYEHPLRDPQTALENVTHLLISTPPNDTGDPSFLMHADDIKHLKNLEWIGYLSTTGVYGDRQGRWVDETAEPAPSSQRGSRRLKAEEQWLSLFKQYNLPVHVFRLAGIYGPGRSALDSVRAGLGRRIFKQDQVFGRIHVDDIVNILSTSMDRPMAGEVFNVCDNMPAPSHKVVEYACELLNRIPPPIVDFEEANLAPMTRSFYMDNRRTSNQKIKSVLGVELKYPDFKTGLNGCLKDDQNAASTQAESFQKPAIFGGNK